MVLTRVERNEIFEIIDRSDIDVADCDTYATADSTYFTHKSGAEFVFQLIDVSNNNVPLFAIGACVPDGSTPRMPDAPIPVGIAGSYIEAWATEIELVSETPDLWAELKRARTMIVEIQQADTGNAPFTEDEQRLISAGIQELKKHLKELGQLTAEQVAHVDERLDEVVEASRRLGRTDWFVYVLGTVTAFTIAPTVPSGLGEHILIMVFHGLANLFTGKSEPPLGQ